MRLWVSGAGTQRFAWCETPLRLLIVRWGPHGEACCSAACAEALRRLPLPLP